MEITLELIVFTVLALFIGGYIPASVISSSAQEFVNVQMYYSPIWFVINSLCLAIGTFVIWFGICLLYTSDAADE